MKNFFKINSSSDNITPLSPNPPPQLGRNGRSEFKGDRKGSLPALNGKKISSPTPVPNLFFGQSYNTSYSQQQQQQQAKLQHHIHPLYQKLQHPIQTQFKNKQKLLSAPLDSHSAIRAGPDHRLEIHHPGKKIIFQHSQNTIPRHNNHLNNVGINPIPQQSFSTHNLLIQPPVIPERPVRSFSDSSMAVETSSATLTPLASTVTSSSNSTSRSMIRTSTICVTPTIIISTTTPDTSPNPVSDTFMEPIPSVIPSPPHSTNMKSSPSIATVTTTNISVPPSPKERTPLSPTKKLSEFVVNSVPKILKKQKSSNTLGSKLQNTTYSQSPTNPVEAQVKLPIPGDSFKQTKGKSY